MWKLAENRNRLININNIIIVNELPPPTVAWKCTHYRQSTFWQPAAVKRRNIGEISSSPATKRESVLTGSGTDGRGDHRHINGQLSTAMCWPRSGEKQRQVVEVTSMWPSKASLHPPQHLPSLYNSRLACIVFLVHGGAYCITHLSAHKSPSQGEVSGTWTSDPQLVTESVIFGSCESNCTLRE